VTSGDAFVPVVSANHTPPQNSDEGRHKNQQQHRIPNFLIAGSQKGGTTALADYLFRRKDVCGPRARKGFSYTGKEAHFFDEPQQMARGLAHYESLFAHCSPDEKRHKIVLDATPKYMLYHENIYKVYEEANTTVKILFILREPVSRDLSWYNHLLRETKKAQPPSWVAEEGMYRHSSNNNTRSTQEVKTFEEYALSHLLPSIRSSRPTNRGLYAHWLKPWLELFDRRQIFIASYDDLQRDPSDFLRRLHAFLELPEPPIAASLPRSNHKKVLDAAPIPCEIQEQLAAKFSRANEELYDLLESHSAAAPPTERRPFPKFEFRCKEG